MTSQERSSIGIRTPLSDLLGIDVPILQSGMGRVAGPELAAEVSRAGGLGILAGLRLSAAELRRQIHRLRELTDRPFGVNLWLHPDVETPVDVRTLPEDLVQNVQDTLNRFRDQLDLPARMERPAGMPDVVEDARALAASGVDAIVAQGGEAGGHRSTWVERKSPADVGTLRLFLRW